MLVGVEDDGRVTGARPRHESSDIDLLRIQALVANRTRPSLSTRVEVAEVNGHEVLVVEVPAMRQPVGTADGRYLRRTIGGDGKPSCVPFHFHEMQSQQAHHGLLDHSALPLDGMGMDALEPLEFDRYRRPSARTGLAGIKRCLTSATLSWPERWVPWNPAAARKS